VLSGKGGLEAHSLRIREKTLRDQIDRFYGQLKASSEDFAASRNAMGKWLYDQLIPPVVAERIAHSERLVIIPDRPLHYLPFAALIRVTEDGNEQYLVEWKPVHTALSATVHAHLRKERPEEKPADRTRPFQLAAFGNPSYPSVQDGERALTLVRSAVDRGLFDGFVPLPHSGREVTTIAGLYPAGAARTWVGPDATEDRAKALGKDVRIVHFAVHGVADPENPLDSFLAFTIPGQPAEGRDNGLLQAWEIFERVRLDADLVVLSACQTALGPQRGGEGLMSLSRAFQYAGARTVAASLWSVNDASTAELMIRFYRHLEKGKPKDEALRAAQIELIRGGPIEVVDENGDLVEEDFSAPYHWAAFQLIGDWQ
jgi:CHAT domain-containing protein